MGKHLASSKQVKKNNKIPESEQFELEGLDYDFGREIFDDIEDTVEKAEPSVYEEPVDEDKETLTVVKADVAYEDAENSDIDADASKQEAYDAFFDDDFAAVKKLNEVKDKIPFNFKAVVANDVEPISMHDDYFKRAVFPIVSILMLVSNKFLNLDGVYFAVLCGAALLFSGYLNVISGIKAAFRGKVFSSTFLITLSCALAFAVGEYSLAAYAMIVSEIVNILVAVSVKNCRDAAASISAIDDGVAYTVTDGQIQEIDTDDIVEGDTVFVKRGSLIPVDGTVLEGDTSADISAISGTNETVFLSQGDKVLSGWRINGNDVKIKAEKTCAMSTAVRLLMAAEGALDSKNENREKLIDAAGSITAGVSIFAVLMMILPPLSNGEWGKWILRGAAMIYAASFESVISVMPLPHIGGIVSAFKNGIIIKSTETADKFASAKRVVFSKRGVLTNGVYSLRSIFTENIDEQELIDITAAAEKYSKHPIAKAIRGAAKNEVGESIRPVEDVPGRGISTFVDNKLVFAGNAQFLSEHGVECVPPNSFGTAIHVAVNSEYKGYMIVNDDVREETFDSIETVRSLGTDELVMLTGDVSSNARKVASRLNFSMIKAGLDRDEKAKALEYLLCTKNAGTSLAYVSRGIENEKLLFMSDVGVAIDAMRDEDMFAVADIAVMADSISKVAEAKQICTLASKCTLYNTFGAAGIKAILEILCLLGAFNIFTASIIDLVLIAALIINSYRTYIAFLRREKNLRNSKKSFRQKK